MGWEQSSGFFKSLNNVCFIDKNLALHFSLIWDFEVVFIVLQV